MVDVEMLKTWKCEDVVRTPKDKAHMAERMYRVGMVTPRTDGTSAYSCVYLSSNVVNYSKPMASRTDWLDELESLKCGVDELQWKHYKLQNKGGIRWEKLWASDYFHRTTVSSDIYRNEDKHQLRVLAAAKSKGSMIEICATTPQIRWMMNGKAYIWVLLIADWLAFASPGRAISCLLNKTLTPDRSSGETLTRLVVWKHGALGKNMQQIFKHFRERAEFSSSVISGSGTDSESEFEVSSETEYAQKTVVGVLSLAQKRKRGLGFPEIPEIPEIQELSGSDSPRDYVPGYGFDMEDLRELYQRSKRPEAELAAMRHHDDTARLNDLLLNSEENIVCLRERAKLHRIDLEHQRDRLRQLEDIVKWTEDEIDYENVRQCAFRAIRKQRRTYSPIP